MLNPVSPAKKLNGLDHLRALAITLVFIFHYRMFNHPAWVDDVGSFGWTGVDLFFVLSGYLIAGQLFSKIARGGRISLKDFFLKRFFRIIPAYAVVLALYFFIPAFREREALAPFWRFASFTQNFGLDLSKHGTFSHAWSLCIEEQFYLVLPLLILLFLHFKVGKKAFLLLPLLFVVGFAARMISWDEKIAPFLGESYGINWYQWIYYPTYNRLDGLLAGVALAGIIQFLPGIKNFLASKGNWLFLLAIVLLTTAWFVCEDPYSYAASIAGFPLVALSYGVLVSSAISPSCWLYRVRSGITTGLATLSYSIYLSHKGVIHIVQPVFADWGIENDSNLMFFCCIIACLLAALLLRYLVERPFLLLRDKILKKPFMYAV